MEKFIKQYGLWIVGAIAVYWFFIRQKDEEEEEEEEVVVDIGDGESSNWRALGRKYVRRGVGTSGGGCGECTAPTECCQSSFPFHCRKCPKGVAPGTRIISRAPRAYMRGVGASGGRGRRIKRQPISRISRRRASKWGQGSWLAKSGAGGGGTINECPCPKNQKCVTSGGGNRYCVLAY